MTQAYTSALKVFITAGLLTLYLAVFGYQSLARYLEQEVIINRRIVSAETLQPPGPAPSQSLDIHV